MKLYKNTWGEDVVEFRVGKLSEAKDGEVYGLGKNDVFEGVVAYDPLILRANKDKYKNGNPVRYNTVKMALKDVPNVENLELNEWNNASFLLPNTEAFIKKIEEHLPLKGKSIKIYREPFEKEIKNKDGEMVLTKLEYFEFEVVDEKEVKVHEEAEVKEEPVEDHEVSQPIGIKPSVVTQVKEALEKGEVSEDEIVEVPLENGMIVDKKVKDIVASSLGRKTFGA